MSGRNASREGQRQGRALVEALASMPLFRILGDEGLADTAGAGRCRTYSPGQIICHQGDPGDQLFVLVHGLAKVVFSSERGDEMVLNILGPRELFGELALLDGSPRSASVVALQPTVVFILPRARLLELMRHNPGLAEEFLSSIGRIVRRLTEKVGDMAFLDLGGRLAKLLLQISARGDRRHDLVLDGEFTQSDLAGMVGASRPAVNRALKSLAARGLVAVRGRVVEIRDLEGLRKRSEA